MNLINLVLSRRIRTTPFEQRVFEHGAKAFTVYNKMTLPSVFESIEADYAHLCEHVQIWDVACERQIEVAGKDALELVELVTPRDMSRCEVGQCMYAPLVDESGGMVNDPVILRLAEDRFWISLADSDALLWLKGIAYGRGMDVTVFEPDVSPLAIQGPKSNDLMSDVLGEHVRDIGFFRFIETEIVGVPVILARSGWSGQGGFEIYLTDSSRGLALWDRLWEAGERYRLRAGGPNLIERIESGLLTYGTDMTLENNPAELGLDRFYKLGKPAAYMSREALGKIAAQGVRQKLVRLLVEGDPLAPARSTFDVGDEQGNRVGMLTSQAYSPRFGSILAFAMVAVEFAEPGQTLIVHANDGERRTATVVGSDWKPV